MLRIPTISAHGMSANFSRIDVASSLAHHFEVSDNRIHSFPVSAESVEIAAFNELFDRICSIEHVLDAKTPIPRRHGSLLSGSDREAAV